MGLEKTEIKRHIFNDVGADVEDLLDGASAQKHEHMGAAKALRAQAINTQAMVKLVDDDLEAGKLKGLSELEIAKYAKLQYQRAVDGLSNAAQREANAVLVTQGGMSALKSVVGMIEKKMKGNEARKESILRAEKEQAAKKKTKKKATKKRVKSNGANAR